MSPDLLSGAGKQRKVHAKEKPLFECHPGPVTVPESLRLPLSFFARVTFSTQWKTFKNFVAMENENEHY